MAVRPLVINEDGCDTLLPDGVPLSTNPAVELEDVPQMGQMQAYVMSTLQQMVLSILDYRIQYSTEDIEAGVAGLPTGCVYLVYEVAPEGSGENPPSVPVGLSLNSATSTTLTVAWTAQYNITGYILYYKEVSSPTWSLASNPSAGATSETITGLTADTSYNIRLHAVSDSGTSAAAFLTVSTTT